jgi:carbonic anhydrase
MRKLLEGILDFQANRKTEYGQQDNQLANSQNPDALFITCSDSRVVPNVFASTNPGDLFVMRNVGNIVPNCCEHSGLSKSDDSEIAALEYAILFLSVKDIIVCGHSNCGAIQSICDGLKTDAAPHLQSWLNHAKESLDQSQHTIQFDEPWSLHDQVSQKNALLQVEHLKTYSFVQKALEAKTLSLHAWWFDLEHRNVYVFNPEENKFKVIDQQEKDRILAAHS